MARIITLTDCRIRKIEINKHYPDGGTPYYQVIVHYEVLDDSDPAEPITYQQITRFSSDSGLSSGLLPAVWETTFDTLIADLESKLDDVEQLNV